jgi:deazaflavin-dependent oxidoreductase (nitroreductase family)
MSMPASMLRGIGKFNVPLYRLSGGRVGGKVGKAPVLLLTTTGRKSGQQRTAPVVFLADGERLVVIGSNAGNEKTPAWAYNLRANPDAEVEVRRDRRRVRARVTEGDERAELWRKMNEQYAGFDDYAAKANRDIAVFALEPVT